jgi:energy-coupling factor transport system ATP-binding protein
MSERIIQVDNLILKYFPESRLRFSVYKGEIVAICGENGSGKSTLARMLAGLLPPEQPGCIRIQGMDPYYEEQLGQLHRKCGLVFQNPENQMVYQDPVEDMAFGMENLAIPTEAMEPEIQKMAEELWLGRSMGKSVSQLSGGEQQRLALADMLIMKQDILILDEITAMQDIEGRKRLLDTLIYGTKKMGKTLIFISHHPEELAKADRVLKLNRGTICELEKDAIRDRETRQWKPAGMELIGKKDIRTGNGMDGMQIAEFRVKATGGLEAAEVRVEAMNRNAEPTHRIQCDQLCFSYGQSQIISDFSYSFYPGHLYIISGKTGSGKSTLAQLLNGLLLADAGSVSVNGQHLPRKGRKGWKDVEGLNRHSRKRAKALFWNQLRRTVGYVTQYPERQLFRESVISDVMFGPENMGFSAEKARRRSEEALRQMQVSETLWNRSPWKLSGGEKRRVAIAGILAMEPEYLVLDEPEAGLDLDGITLLRKQMDDLVKQGRCVIVISHNWV